jgi:hypothetical protein
MLNFKTQIEYFQNTIKSRDSSGGASIYQYIKITALCAKGQGKTLTQEIKSKEST